MAFLAIDVGGTKVAVALVTPEGAIVAKTRQPTDLAGPEALIDQIAAMTGELASGMTAIDAIGVSMPAVLENETDRVLWAPNLPGWRNIAMREALTERLQAPAFIEYDGHAAVLGEWWIGAGKGYQNVASIIIGTGIGGGLIVGGRLWRGRDRLAGAVGWFPLEGPAGIDHWENLAAGPGIARRTQQLIREGDPSSLDADTLTAKEVFEAARLGDALAQRVVRETSEITGRGVASVISMGNPEIIVLGGSVGQQGDLILEAVRDTARQWAQPISATDVVIVSSVLGEEAGLLGAAYAAYLRLSAGV